MKRIMRNNVLYEVAVYSVIQLPKNKRTNDGKKQTKFIFRMRDYLLLFSGSLTDPGIIYALN